MEKVQQKRKQVRPAPLCKVKIKPTTNQIIRFATLCYKYIRTFSYNVSAIL